MSYYSTKRSYPNSSEVKKILQDPNSTVYEDYLGRIYGYVDGSNWIVQGYERSGRSGKLMWIFLDRKQKSKDPQFKAYLNDQALVFPNIGEQLALFDYHDERVKRAPIDHIVITEYPEVSLKRTSSVYVEFLY